GTRDVRSASMERCDLLGLSAWNGGSLLVCSAVHPCFRVGCADPRAVAVASAEMQSRLLLTPYKYRFFNCGCGNVPALDVFVFCDDPSPFAFSSSSPLSVEAVSGTQ